MGARACSVSGGAVQAVFPGLDKAVSKQVLHI